MHAAIDDLAMPVPTLRVGRPGPLGNNDATSAIHKQPVTDARWLDTNGVAGDTQADRVHHGGAERALNHYPVEHYAVWRQRFAGTDDVFLPGVLGENISTDGITEDDVHAGDIFALGGATIQITQPRMPCWKIDTRTGVKGLARALSEQGRAGWLYRVLEAGEICAGDRLERLERAGHGITLAQLWQAFNTRQPDATQRDQLRTLAQLPALAPVWRKTLSKRAR